MRLETMSPRKMDPLSTWPWPITLNENKLYNNYYVLLCQRALQLKDWLTHAYIIISLVQCEVALIKANKAFRPTMVSWALYHINPQLDNTVAFLEIQQTQDEKNKTTISPSIKLAGLKVVIKYDVQKTISCQHNVLIISASFISGRFPP